MSAQVICLWMWWISQNRCTWYLIHDRPGAELTRAGGPAGVRDGPGRHPDGDAPTLARASDPTPASCRVPASAGGFTYRS